LGGPRRRELAFEKPRLKIWAVSADTQVCKHSFHAPPHHYRLSARLSARTREHEFREHEFREEDCLLIRCRPALLVTALACTVFSAPFCRASQTPNDDPAATLAASADSEASQAAPAEGAAPATHSTSIRRYHRRRVSRHGVARSLPSRGLGSLASPPASVVGRLGVVISDKAVISAGREAAGRVLSVCPKGQNLALCGQTATQYAVLMVDRSLGFVAKSDVQLLEMQVVSNAPEGTSDPSVTVTGGPLGQALVQTAQGYLGVPYVWGGNTASGIDCSGFVKAVYSAHGITLPRHSGDQATVGYDVPKTDWSQWVAGDRMYFACHHPEIDHTGMYIGGGYFIHASMGHGQSVAIDRVDVAFYAQHLVCVRRSRELQGDAQAQTVAASSTSSADDAENSQR